MLKDKHKSQGNCNNRQFTHQVLSSTEVAHQALPYQNNSTQKSHITYDQEWVWVINLIIEIQCYCQVQLFSGVWVWSSGLRHFPKCVVYTVFRL